MSIVMTGPSTTTSSPLPAPHGGTLINRVQPVNPEAYANLPELSLSSRAYADLECIASGVYSPLEGFMGEADYHSVVKDMRLANGLAWSVPITLSVPADKARLYHDQVVLSYAGKPVGLLEVSEQYTPDKQLEAEAVYRTTDSAHPGVAALLASGEVNLGGRVTLFSLPRGEFPESHFTPAETRAVFAEKGWRSVVAFQTRNPIHRAHEYLHKVALEHVDGLFLNPLVGTTKSDDISAGVRMRAYNVLLEKYYPRDRVFLGVYPAAMRYAGPREAILHALSRKNYGCTHFIVGRDHAGVGSYYGTYDAQTIFDGFEADELGITPLKFEHAFYCLLTNQMATSRTSPSTPEQRLHLSGTKVREKLVNGEDLPPEFSRPEVAEVLRAAYQNA